MQAQLVSANEIDTRIQIVFQPPRAKRCSRVKKLAGVLFLLPDDISAVGSSGVTELLQGGNDPHLDMFRKQPLPPAPDVVFELLLPNQLEVRFPKHVIAGIHLEDIIRLWNADKRRDSRERGVPQQSSHELAKLADLLDSAMGLVRAMFTEVTMTGLSSANEQVADHAVFQSVRIFDSNDGKRLLS